MMARVANAARSPGRTALAFVLAGALLSRASLVYASDITPAENVRIEYLISVIAALPGAQFIRNGTAYDARSAVDHLRLKLRFAGSRVKNAEDFIRYCASQSSVSGQPYEIRLADGRVVPSAQFLRQKLLEFDRQNTHGGSP